MSILTPNNRDLLERLPRGVVWTQTERLELSHDGSGTLTETVVNTSTPFVFQHLTLTANIGAWQLRFEMRNADGTFQDELRPPKLDGTGHNSPTLNRFWEVTDGDPVPGFLGIVPVKGQLAGGVGTFVMTMNVPLLFPDGGRIRLTSAFTGALAATVVIDHLAEPA